MQSIMTPSCQSGPYGWDMSISNGNNKPGPRLSVFTDDASLNRIQSSSFAPFAEK
jgi:hypothetical protein